MTGSWSRALASGVALLATACAKPAEKRPRNPPPAAEFLVSSTDSTFWVATTAGEPRVRGAPLVLAAYDGRFYELYSADDDYSFPSATLVGDRLYRRDLLSGDSLVVFADTTVPRVAREYAKAHPDERPLGPDDEGDANPATTITAEIDILDVHGPYASYEYHVDMQLPGRDLWHATRRGVVDLRTGKAQSVDDLVGSADARRIIAVSRAELAHTRDSIRAALPKMSDDERRAAAALAKLDFDERSFSVTDVDGRAAIRFSLPGHGTGASGNAVELDAVPTDSAAWWPQVATGLAKEDDSGGDQWTASGYRVLARYDTSGDIAHLSITDSTRAEWPIGTVETPVHRIDWLDRPPISGETRRALTRAFGQAAGYDRATRVATLASRGITHLVSVHASNQERSRKPARDVRAHDARAREQHGARVRRRDSVHDGQVRGDRRVSSQPGERGDGVDRSRRLSRADSPGRSRRDEGERQLRRNELDGGGRACGGGRSDDRAAPAHQLVLFDVRCR